MTNISSAERILKAFISRMNEWELRYYPLFRNEVLPSHKDESREELDEIYDVFCTKKERKQGRQVALDCSEPPEYSPDEEILSSELNKNKAVFVTQQHTGFKNKYRYTLRYKNNEWRIDKKERFSPVEDKWIKDSL